MSKHQYFVMVGEKVIEHCTSQEIALDEAASLADAYVRIVEIQDDGSENETILQPE